ncbi:hypothetical protein K502DRAFT_364993 [Neoconidiobolus thromboides FSU 785]|nr:hypothetical protein K502DRAFT_364993 [Neoconidiobolus thromboides FSU 785]
MSKKIGSRYMASVLGDKLRAVNLNGFQLKPAHFKKEIIPSEYNNGARGGFVVQCNRLVLSYCESGGSSKGVSNFVKQYLVPFAKQNPETEVIIKHQPWKHPKIEARYNCGTVREVEIPNFKPKEILTKFQALQSSQGGKEVDFSKRRVLSTNESVRGMWSPFHAAPHKI